MPIAQAVTQAPAHPDILYHPPQEHTLLFTLINLVTYLTRIIIETLMQYYNHAFKLKAPETAPWCGTLQLVCIN